MALNFPTSPTVGPPPTTYGRWQWNGVGWAPIVTVSEPMLPIAGGNVTGNLGVAGTTSLTGTLTAAGATQLNTLDVNGQATFLDGVTIDGVNTDDFALTSWVQDELDAIKNLGFFAGSFADFASVPTNRSALPGLTANDFITVQEDESRGGATTRYIATDIAADGTITWTYDFTYSTDITGKMDLVPTATDGNLAVFDDSGDGQVEDGGIAPTDLMRQGTPGIYTQGTDFTDFQTFLDEEVNNRWFNGALTINLNVANAAPVFICNVFFRQRVVFRINTTEQIATSLTVRTVLGHSELQFFPTGNVDPVWTSARFEAVNAFRIAGDGRYRGGTVAGMLTVVVLGQGGSTLTIIDNLTLELQSNGFPSSDNTPVTITALTVSGVLTLNENNTNVTLPTTIGGRGMIIDNRPGRPLDTFQRYPETEYFTSAGTYSYFTRRAGLYEIQAIGGGGAGTAWIGNPPFGTTGSPPKTMGGTSGQTSRKQVRLPAGFEIQLIVGRGGTQTDATHVGSGATGGWAEALGGQSYVGQALPGNTDADVSPLRWNSREIYAVGGWSGWGTGHSWGGQQVVQVGANGTATAGGVARSLAGTAWNGQVRLQCGKGGDPGACGQDGAVSIAFVSP